MIYKANLIHIRRGLWKLEFYDPVHRRYRELEFPTETMARNYARLAPGHWTITKIGSVWK